MDRQFYLSAFFIALILLLSSCGGSDTAGNSTNSNVNVNSNSNSSGHQPMTTTRNEGPTVNDAPTLGPVVQAYYAALEKKDDSAIRETLATEFVKTLEADMKAEKKSNLAAYLAETDWQPGLKIEVRNEKIEGDKGNAQIRGGVYKNWTALAFVKENGKWKLSNESPEIKAVDPHGSAK